LGLPATTPYAALMAAVMRDGRFADEYVADITEINRTVGAAVAQSIALARERLERTLTGIGYRPATTDIADLVTEGADPSDLVFSRVIAQPVSVLGITTVPLNPITFERLAVPDLLGGQLGPDPAVVVRACGGPGPCNYPQPYDL